MVIAIIIFLLSIVDYLGFELCLENNDLSSVGTIKKILIVLELLICILYIVEFFCYPKYIILLIVGVIYLIIAFVKIIKAIIELKK